MVKMILAVAVLVSTFNAQAATPQDMFYLKPYKTFQRGEGEGVAYEYKSRSKADVAALLKDPAKAKKELRLDCKTLVSQMAEAHGLPFEGCQGAVAEIEKNDDYKVVACQDSMFTTENWLSVTNNNGTAHGAWHRKCLVGEQVLVYKNQPLMSTTCMNVAIPVKPVARVVTPAPKPVASEWRPKTVIAPLQGGGTCPPILTVRIFQNPAASLPGVAGELQKVRSRPEGSTATTDGDGSESHRVSRGHGEEVQKSGVPRSITPHNIVVALVRGSQEMTLFEGPITGEKVIPRPAMQEGDQITIRAMTPGDFASPSRFGNTVWFRELRDCGRNIVTLIQK